MNPDIALKMKQIEVLREEVRLLSLQEDPDLMAKIQGNEIVRRALEIAAVKPHSVCIVGKDENTEALIIVAGQLGVPAFSLKPCLCGNFGSLQTPCACSGESHAAYRQSEGWQRMLKADLIVEALPLAYHGATRLGETLTVVQERVAWAKTRGLPDYVDTAEIKAMLRFAVSELALSQERLERIQQLSCSIAALAGEDRVQCLHVMEAIQYMSHPYVR